MDLNALIQDNLFLLVGLGATATIILIFSLFSSEGASSRDVKRRLSRAAGNPDSPTTAVGSILRDQSDSSVAAIDKLLKAFLPNRQKLRERILRSGKKVTISQYLIASLGLFAVTFAIVAKVLGFNMIIALCAGVVVSVGLPHFTIGFLIKRRQNKFLDQLPEAIDLVCRGLRAGLPISQAISTVSKEIPSPVGDCFAEVANAVKLGNEMETAMWDIARRIGLPEFNFMVIAMSIQKETGGNLSETLVNLAELLRRRRQMKLKIKAVSAEAKAGAYIIGALPFIMFKLILIINPSYAMVLLNDPRGHVIIGIGLTMIAMGAGTMFKMVRFEI